MREKVNARADQNQSLLTRRPPESANCGVDQRRYTFSDIGIPEVTVDQLP
jgi:hypothetical protein